MPANILAIANDAPAIAVNPNSAATSPTSRKIAAPFSIGIPRDRWSNPCSGSTQGNDLAYLRPEVPAMAQKSNATGPNEPGASVPQEPEDELEMANDDEDEDFEDDEDVDGDDTELDEDDVEE
jgi:hypothetical protein